MTINQRTRTPSQRVKRLRPGFDRLDERLVLSTMSTGAGLDAVLSGSLRIVATEPAPSSTVATSPQSVSITFDRPIDPFSVGVSDFRIVPLASDGTISQTVSGANYDEAIDPADPAQSRISLTLDSPLKPGKYEVLLVGANLLQAQDGTVLAGNGQDQAIDTFRVGVPSGGLASAIDLGTVGAKVAVVVGSLDLADNPDAVKLYKIELAPGHFQRLGLEITTIGDGAALSTTLSLFDSQEKLISTSVRTAADPYLFAGLAAGTYYVGVSGAGNAPGATGGYQPSASSSVVATVEQAGGAFSLSYVSDVVSQPTQVLGVEVDHADPGSPTPSGFTLDFSGSLQTASLGDPSNPAVTLVDQSGQAWPLTVVKYDAANAKLSVVFDESLPTGHYTVELGGTGALVDLAGLAPVASHEPAGVLGAFDVATSSLSSGDLGVVYPSTAEPGLSSSVTITPDATYTGEFTVVKPGVYLIKQTGGALGINVATASGSATGTMIKAAPTPEGLLMILPAGVYNLSATNDEVNSVVLAFQIQERQTPFTSLLDTGVGQGPALNLRLVAPSASGSSTPGNGSSVSTGLNPQPSNSAFTTGLAGAGAGVGVGSASPSLNLTAPVGSVVGFVVVGTPFGRPSVQSDQISVVGPATNSSLGAVALNSDGLPGGLVVIPLPISRGADPEPEAPPLNDLAMIANPPNLVNLASPPKPVHFVSGNADGDQVSLNEAAWVEQILAWTTRKLEAISFNGQEVAITPTPGGPTISLQSKGETGLTEPEASRIEVASLASPVGLGLALFVAIRYRRRQASLAAHVGPNPGGRSTNRFFRGPHGRRFSSR